MTAGKRDQRVTFQRNTPVDDGQGGHTDSWATYCERWCEVKPLSGRERDMAQQTEAPRNYRLTVPRDSGTAALTAADRAVWRSKTMQIRFIADAGPSPLEMTIDCEDGVAT